MSARLVALALTVALAAALALPAVALGGKLRWTTNTPKKYLDGTVTISYLDRDGDGALSWNDQAVYHVTPPSLLRNWIAYPVCTQSGTAVYYGGGRVNTATANETFTLDSLAWADNTGADCTFRVASVNGSVIYYWGSVRLAVAP